MDEEVIEDDFRKYKERNFLQRGRNPFFQVYMLLAISLLLTGVYYTVVLSKVATLSSELSKIDTDFLEQISANDSLSFPCGTDTREWEYFNGKCYYFSLDKGFWMTAKESCQARRSQLVIINNMAEQNFLQTRTRNERFWIGLTDWDTEGIWRWLDGSDYDRGFKYWKKGEPNDDGGNEDCAHLWFDGEWNDVYCTFPCYYICEKPLPHTRYIATRKWRHSLVYGLLVLSYLLIIMLFGFMLPKVLTLSSEMNKMHTQLQTNKELYPCGSRNREWEYFDGRCYYFSVKTAIWHLAKSHCEAQDSHLVVINDEAEQNFIQSQSRNENFWIGFNNLNAEKQWRWIDGTEDSKGFQNWLMGEPNNHNNHENCAMISIAGGWNDADCNVASFYVCEKPLPS